MRETPRKMASPSLISSQARAATARRLASALASSSARMLSSVGEGAGSGAAALSGSRRSAPPYSRLILPSSCRTLRSLRMLSTLTPKRLERSSTVAKPVAFTISRISFLRSLGNNVLLRLED